MLTNSAAFICVDGRTHLGLLRVTLMRFLRLSESDSQLQGGVPAEISMIKWNAPLQGLFIPREERME